MRIVDIMSVDLVVPDLRGRTREAVLDELVGHIVEVTPGIERSHANRVLLERERLGSTGVGNGIAIPHARLSSLDRAVACFARSKDGVAFGAVDGLPAHLFLALLAPEGRSGLHLKALARASRLFKSAAFRERLMEAPDDRAHIWKTISAEDSDLPE